MPVSTEHRPSPKRCKHCEEANHGDSVYWNIQLDQDLFNTIVSIYPEWFKGSMNKNTGRASSSGMASSDSTAQRSSTAFTSASTASSTTSSAASAASSSLTSSTVNGVVQQQLTATIAATSSNIISSGGGSGNSQATLIFPRSPPKAEVDDSPLKKSMDRNKQSLKVKLMLRRPITQLVAQGIMPQLKISPTIHEQRQKLERAKMGDLLKAKIQQRPDRQELVRQHILEPDVGHVDPSLAERHRMLKKCRLVDSLNDQLSHRPGPLELIKKNILHTDEPIERAVKEGHIEFRATCEGQKIKLEPPDHYMTLDDDSQSSDSQSPRDGSSFIAGSDLSPPSSNGCVTQSTSSSLSSSSTVISSVNSTTTSSSHNNSNNAEHNVYSELFSITASDMLETAAKQAGIVTVVVPSANLVSSSTTAAPSPISIGSSTSSLSPMSSVASPSSISNSNNIFSCSSPALSSSRSGSFSIHHQSSARDKSRKKSKSKSQQQKARTIKFHEYKGPPNAHKQNSNSSSSNSETSYDLLLKQQQLFLQWQLEWQQKYPQLKMPITAKNMEHVSPSISPQLVNVPSPSPTNMGVVQIKQEPLILSPSSTPPPIPPPLPPPLPTNMGVKLLRNLEDMKVSDLKAELKKRNLPMSGPKPSLILRLKPFTEVNTNNRNSHNNSSITNDHQNINNAQSNRIIPYSEESLPDSSVPSPMQHHSSHSMSVGNGVEHMDVSTGHSPQPVDTSVNKVTSSVESSSSATTELTDEEIIKEQQKKIEELQRQLLNSQLLLQQQRQQQLARSTQTFQPQQAISAKANLAAFLQQQQLNHLLIQQQQKLQQKQSRMQQTTNGIINGQTVASNYTKQPKAVNVQVKNEIPIKSNAQRQTSNAVIIGERPVTLMLNPITVKSNNVHHQQRRTSASLPNFVGTFVQPQLVLANDGSIQHLVIDNDTIFVPDRPVKANIAVSTSAAATVATLNTNRRTNTNASGSSGNIIVSAVPTSISTVNRIDTSRKLNTELQQQQQRLLFDTSIATTGNRKIVLENPDGGRLILENGTNRLILKDGSQFVFTNSGDGSSTSNESQNRNRVESVNEQSGNDYVSSFNVPSVSMESRDDDNDATNETKRTSTDFDILADNNEISELFKHDGERSIEDVDDVLDMLMRSEEFLSIGDDKNGDRRNFATNAATNTSTITTTNNDDDDFADIIDGHRDSMDEIVMSTSSASAASPCLSSINNGNVVDNSIYTFQTNDNDNDTNFNRFDANTVATTDNNSSGSISRITDSTTTTTTSSSSSNSSNSSNHSTNNGNITNCNNSINNSINSSISKGDIADPSSLPSDHVSLEALGLDVESFPPVDLMEQDEDDIDRQHHYHRRKRSSSFSKNRHHNSNHNHQTYPATELMDVDNDWLDRLISSEFENAATLANMSSMSVSPPPSIAQSTNGNYDPMISGVGAATINDPLDFFSIDDNDYKMAAEFCWDRVDFAT